MIHSFKTLPFLMLALLAGLSQAQAQGLRLPTTPGASPAPSAASSEQADFIVAIVNSEPITNNEVRREVQLTLQRLAAQKRPQPDIGKLSSEVLDNLINVKTQMQWAQESGIRADDAAVDQSELAIAQQNKFDVPELRRRVEQDGMTVSQFRGQLRDQILLQRVREREVEGRIKVSDAEIDQYLIDQQSTQDLSAIQLNLAQILVAVPEAATPEQIEALRKRAERALLRARAGDDFAGLVREFSDTTDFSNGGQLGLREASRYPELFVQATRNLTVGEVAAPVRTAAGFHVLKVIEKGSANLPTSAVLQSHSRHILLLPNAQMDETQAKQKLADFKKQVMTGQTSFEKLAKEYSKDGSAAQGGDLGWASPGMFVPEFESAMNRLAPGDISDPVVSRFGVHLIQLLERRKATLTKAQERESVRSLLRDKKFDETYKTWAQELRGRTYVELREPLQ
jgi:peptidyl-prolyl cis-trans isomerase SurA